MTAWPSRLRSWPPSQALSRVGVELFFYRFSGFWCFPGNSVLIRGAYPEHIIWINVGRQLTSAGFQNRREPKSVWDPTHRFPRESPVCLKWRPDNQRWAYSPDEMSSYRCNSRVCSKNPVWVSEMKQSAGSVRSWKTWKSEVLVWIHPGVLNEIWTTWIDIRDEL